MSREQAEGKVVINTELRNKKLIEGYKNISKETDKLISQYNKKVQQIKKEEVALDNLKAKYNQINSGYKTPASLTAMETQIKKNTKEMEQLQAEYDKVVEKINSKQIDFKNAEISGNIKLQDNINTDLFELDNQASEIHSKIEELNLSTNDLKKNLEELKLNPSATIEAQNLKDKIDLAKESLEKSKTEANELAQNIRKAGKVNLNSIIKGILSFGNRINDILVGKKGLNSNINKVGTKLDKFKSRITKMFGTVMIFRLLRSSLTSLSNSFTDLLKSNKNFSNSLNQIKVNLMTAFAPIYNYVLPAINTLMNVLSRVTGSIAQFMASMFGQTAAQAKKNAKELYKQASAQKAVNKAQEEGSIASFDKLEVNGSEDKSSSGNSNELDFSKDMKTMSYLDNLLNDLRNKISNGLFVEAGSQIAYELNDLIRSIDVKGFFDKGNEIAANLSNGLNGFVSSFDWSMLGTKLSDTLRGLCSWIITALQTIDWQAIGQAIGDFLLSIDWIGLISDVINMILSGATAIVDLVIGLIDSIIDVLTNPDSINKFFEAGADLFLGLINGLGSLAESVGELFLKLLDLLNDLLGFDEMVEFGASIIDGLISGISGLIGGIGDLFKGLYNSIKNIFSGLSSWFNSVVVQPIKNAFSSAWNLLTNGARNAWNGIKNVFSTVASFFQNTFANAWSKVKSVFSTGGKIFDGIKEGIVSAFKNIVNAIIRGINKVISVPFNGINSALKKIKNIDILGAKPFKGVINTISTPQIPMLAQGAVIPPNAKFAAILGDQRNGKNLEAPESLIRKIVREESGGNKEVILNGTFIMQCELEEFGRASVKGIRLVESETGTTLLVN